MPIKPTKAHFAHFAHFAHNAHYAQHAKAYVRPPRLRNARVERHVGDVTPMRCTPMR